MRRWWCGTEWLLDEKSDLGGISWDHRAIAAGEELSKDLPLDPAEPPASCSIPPERGDQTRREG